MFVKSPQLKMVLTSTVDEFWYANAGAITLVWFGLS